MLFYNHFVFPRIKSKICRNRITTNKRNRPGLVEIRRAVVGGHLGPMLTFGARMGTAALRAVDAKGYFDVEVTCEGPFVKPPESCFLDGIQISTGANSSGKRKSPSESKAIKSWFTSKISALASRLS